ncbi:MAG: glycosyltransferase [Planctomycetes bacterium]|nr:glycosyltransferase [Planctomycetota bacterium]
MRIGVVIPTLNEEPDLGRTLALLADRGSAAIVVVADCGSRDRTAEIAAAAGAEVVRDPALDNRAAAMNAGIRRALQVHPDVDALWFLHADTEPAPQWDEHIAETLADPRVVGGAFDFQWDKRGVAWTARVPLTVMELINRIRFRVTRSYFGDQGIFARPEALRAVGGVPSLSLMEDVVLCRLLKRHGRLRLARGRTVTSPRRFLRHGVVRQGILDLALLFAERAGLQPTRVHAWYNREKA